MAYHFMRHLSSGDVYAVQTDSEGNTIAACGPLAMSEYQDADPANFNFDLQGEDIVDFDDAEEWRLMEGDELLSEATMAREENKIAAVVDGLEALKRGVAEPTIVLEDDGSYEYIPGAYLSDGSYTGSRTVVMELSVDGIGGFDPTEADDDEIRSVAEWVAEQDEWWVVEEDE